MYSGTSRNSINSNAEEELHGSSGRSSSSNNGLQQPGVAAGVSLHQFSSQPRLDSDGNADFAPRPRPRPGRTSLAPTPARSISGSNGAEPNPFLTYSRHSIYSNSHASLSRGSIYGLGTPPVNKRMSHTLVNGSSALDMYREAAKKTQDERIQLEYAKFLLQSIENLEDPTVREDFNVTYSVYLPGSDPLAAALSGGANSSSASLPLGQQATEVDPENREKLVAEAVYWVKLLQRKGNTEASYIAGTWFESGKYGIELDKSKALQLFTYAAKNHHASAAYKVAVHQEERKQYARAFSYFQMAAALGDVSANYRMANVFLDGTLGKKMNVKQALIYLRRAAELANDECPYGALLLGRMYLGEYPNPAVYDVVFVDSEEAQKLLDKAARLGSADAQYLLGRLFEFGECKFPVDPYTSIHYYQLAAEQDSAEAQMALSGWYLSGAEGIINPDDQLTFDWGHRAAQQGLPRAEFAMGYYYEMGIGCEKNINRAIEWYERAASHGSSEAQERLNQRVVGTTSESAAALRRRVTQKREKASGRGKKSVSRKGKDSKDSNGCIVM
ncbi:hypothetical protein GGI12_005274 [Dipsacomyces acuminosporus]|nr:hypothetical protein GGI12_005274 [Dipsacomyces acuminosporus]